MDAIRDLIQPLKGFILVDRETNLVVCRSNGVHFMGGFDLTTTRIWGNDQQVEAAINELYPQVWENELQKDIEIGRLQSQQLLFALKNDGDTPLARKEYYSEMIAARAVNKLSSNNPNLNWIYRERTVRRYLTELTKTIMGSEKALVKLDAESHRDAIFAMRFHEAYVKVLTMEGAGAGIFTAPNSTYITPVMCSYEVMDRNDRQWLEESFIPTVKTLFHPAVAVND